MTELNKVERPAFEKYAISAEQAFLAVADKKVWMREIAFALQILRSNAEAFSKCDPDSIRDSVINIGMTGATLNPILKQAYLVPRSLKGKMKCCLDFDYRGLVKIAVDSDSVLDMDATAVHEKDEFYYEMGLNPTLTHKPFLSGDPGPMTHVYAVAVLYHNIKKFIVLTKAEVDKVRQSSQAPNSLMWASWYEEGARKTAVKKLYKLLPQTEKMAQAIEVLNQHEGLEIDNAGKGGAKEVMARFEKAKVVTDIPEFISADKIDILRATLKNNNKSVEELLIWAGKGRIEDLTIGEYAAALEWAER